LPDQYFDQETNTHYNYFRDYDPAIGRYIQSDPIGSKAALTRMPTFRTIP
jgi:RHS repeat-associated protein